LVVVWYVAVDPVADLAVDADQYYYFCAADDSCSDSDFDSAGSADSDLVFDSDLPVCSVDSDSVFDSGSPVYSAGSDLAFGSG
jgi:hypothetical protein